MEFNLRVRRPSPPPASAARATAAVLLLGSASGFAEEPKHSTFDLSVSGYGELDFGLRLYGADDTREGGALDDVRPEFDTTRFVAKVTGEAGDDLEFEAEIEFEHGGTGVTREVEYDEFGEIETEVEKGGEVQLEELYLEKSFLDRIKVKVGRFYVAVGTLSHYYTPSDYLGAGRSEAETTVIPAQWDEMGISVTADLGRWRVTGQVVNGLDSSGFSTRRWVASGHQGAYESISGRSMAMVARADLSVTETSTVGASFYVGGTTNRPLADLVEACDDPDTDDVAPCGQVSAPLFIGDAHVHVEEGRFRVSGLALAGHLNNAAAISARNDRLSNTFGVDRTPVADNAIALSIEAGYNVGPRADAREAWALWPFLRVEHYDTIVQARSALFDNPRYARTRIGGGLSTRYRHSTTAKLEISRRSFVGSALRAEYDVQLSLGFVY